MLRHTDEQESDQLAILMNYFGLRASPWNGARIAVLQIVFFLTEM
jgi:hypothetical protein